MRDTLLKKLDVKNVKAIKKQTTKLEQKVWETIIGMRSRRYVIGTLNDSVTGEGSIENLLKFE